MTAEQLRKSILQYAIQGKLVPQNPNDEPASVLLQKIQEEKQKLIADGKQKKDKNESFIYKNNDGLYYEKIGKKEINITEEIPFELPNNWSWCRLQTISYTIGTKNNQILSSQILKEGKIKVVSQSKYLIDGYFNDISKQIDDLPVVLFGDHTKVVKYIDFPFVIGADGTKILKTINIYPKYLYLLLKYIVLKIKDRGYARHFSLLKNELFALPPLEEQKRIVEKIEQIEPLIAEYDKLEKQATKLDNEIDDKLKKSILQYAIEGKLVSQNADDEPASVLLERIKAEKKKQLGKKFVDNYIYKAENGNYYENINGKETNITEKIPFEIPNNWAWCRFPNLVSFILGKTPERANTANWINATFPWVSISDMKDKSNIDITKEKITQYALKQSFNNKFSPKGTLLMSFKLTVGRTSILKMDAVHNEAIISIFPYCDKDNIIRDYLNQFLSIIVEYVDTTNAIKGVTLNSKKMSNMLVPVPPLEEQKRIVDKIEEILKLLK